ncbi:MAG TPA: hypothetical protein VIE66_18710 [Methylocella sp.]
MRAPIYRSSELRKKIIKLASAPDARVAELARALRMLHDRDGAGWGPFLERAGIGLRRAYYLVQIDEQLSKLGIQPTTIDNIGWTKLQVIAPYLDKGNKTERLALAKISSTKQLQALARSWKAGKKKKTPASLVPLRCVLLYFTREQYAEFEEAIRANGGEPHRKEGLSNKEAALMNIIGAARQVGPGPKPKTPAVSPGTRRDISRDRRGSTI